MQIGILKASEISTSSLCARVYLGPPVKAPLELSEEDLAKVRRVESGVTSTKDNGKVTNDRLLVADSDPDYRDVELVLQEVANHVHP